MTIIADARVALFVAESVARPIYPPYEALGIEKDGEIIAGAVFNCFTGSDIHITVAGSGWTRAVLRTVGDYVFGQLGCSRITVITEQRHVVGLAERLGGQVEGLARNQFGEGRDAFLMGILAKDWPYRGRQDEDAQAA